MPLKVVCDFDGTITKEDTADAIFTRFAAAEWRDLEVSWENGEIGSAECMRRQMELVDASLAELDAALDEREIDEHFAAFVAFAAARGIELAIVSDGVDYFIQRILKRAGLSHIPVSANRLIRLNERRFSLDHPFKVQDCASGAGVCKCALASKPVGRRTVLIGDGRSDFCVAHETDIVFAKKSLVQYTREQRIAAIEYATFADVQAALENLLAPVQPELSALDAGFGAPV
jgi:2-hydroxy-3-keto-5-methylthiopentenyl-1-phosphate phosphatase